MITGMLESCRTIAVFRALQLGDMLCAVPALRALRAAAPQARITLIGLPWATEFARRFAHYIDDFIAFPGFPSWPEQDVDAAAFPGFLMQVQERHADLLIQMHGSGAHSNPLAVLFGAKRVAGFYGDGQYCPNAATFLPWYEEEHEIQRFVRLMEYLGAPSRGEQLEFPFPDNEAAASVQDADYVCLHPGARLRSRRWFPERFAEVGDRLAKEGLQIVLTGTTSESALTHAIAIRMHAPVIDLCGATNLNGMAKLISGAKLLICNDTGVSHIAAALGTPSVVIACGSDIKRWAPLDTRRHATLAAHVACRPCMHETCPIGHPCAEAVTANIVFEEARKVLSLHPGTS
jgi:ADP-heptose:LPS heptosyltransferase